MPDIRSKFSLTRREFLATSALWSATSFSPPGDAYAGPSGGSWYARMRRCGQINVNERDALNMDVDAWMDYWASLRVNAVLLNGGGIVAFYPTEVPYHHRNSFLGSRDLLGEMVVAARKRQLHIVARMDPNLAYGEALEAHPEWFERNPDGSPRPHDESPWLFRTCMFSTYFTEQMPAIYREINRLYSVDGFFTNGWPSTGALGLCHCHSCQLIYREQLGGVPPAETDSASLLYRKYYDVYMNRVQEIWQLWGAVATEGKPNSVYVGNLGGGIRTVKSLKKLAEVAAWFNADHQGRSGYTPVWDCAQQGRVAASVMSGRTITNVTGAYANSKPLWRHMSKAPAETVVWLAQTTASGMVPWFHWLGASPEDNRWREVGRSFYQWLAANEPHFRNRRSIADLAVLYPQATIAFYKSGSEPGSWRGSERTQTTDYLNGLYYALLEGRFTFDFVHQENLDAETLRKYRALLIPNAAYLRDNECEAIRRFVALSGSVLATFETSRYNEWGDPRPDFGLSDIFGASVAGNVVGPVDNSYMRIEQRHPIVSGFEGTVLLPGPRSRVPVQQLRAASLVLSLVPEYPSFPPEMVYPRTPHTDQPAALIRELGASRVAYFPGDIDRTLWLSGSADLSQFLQNAIRWVLGEARQSVVVTGQGLVEVFAWETEQGYALHILNYNNPNMMHGAIRRFYPIDAQQVDFDVEEGRKISRVRALRTAHELLFTQEGRTVHFKIPGVTDYEVVVLT